MDKNNIRKEEKIIKNFSYSLGQEIGEGYILKSIQSETEYFIIGVQRQGKNLKTLRAVNNSISKLGKSVSLVLIGSLGLIHIISKEEEKEYSDLIEQVATSERHSENAVVPSVERKSQQQSERGRGIALDSVRGFVKSAQDVSVEVQYRSIVKDLISKGRIKVRDDNIEGKQSEEADIPMNDLQGTRLEMTMADWCFLNGDLGKLVLRLYSKKNSKSLKEIRFVDIKDMGTVLFTRGERRGNFERRLVDTVQSGYIREKIPKYTKKFIIHYAQLAGKSVTKDEYIGELVADLYIKEDNTAIFFKRFTKFSEVSVEEREQEQQDFIQKLSEVNAVGSYRCILIDTTVRSQQENVLLGDELVICQRASKKKLLYQNYVLCKSIFDEEVDVALLEERMKLEY